jgi:hypothetical protein
MKYIGIAILLLAFFACKKTEEEPGKGPHCSPAPTRYISPEISKFKFKKGSYWVFVDPVNPIIDTVKLDSITYDGLAAYQYCPDNKYEAYGFLIYSSYFTPSGMQRYTLSDDRLILNQASENDNGIYTTSSPIIDSLFIYDRYYKSVVIFYLSGYKYYINSDFGFLKLEVYDVNGNLLSQKLLKDKIIIR